MSSVREELERLESVSCFETLLGYAPRYRSFVQKRLGTLRLQALLEATLDVRLGEKTRELKQALSNLLEAHEGCRKDSDKKPAFVLSSLLLEESFGYLSQQPEESLHFATGIKERNLILVDHFLPVDLEKATTIFAQASDPSLFRLYSKLERLGHTITGVFHIHPGAGLSSNHPSSTDRSYMKRLDGRFLVFGIWSRDRILRLFIPKGTDLQFYGEGVEEIERNGQEIICRLPRPHCLALGKHSRSA